MNIFALWRSNTGLCFSLVWQVGIMVLRLAGAATHGHFFAAVRGNAHRTRQLALCQISKRALQLKNASRVPRLVWQSALQGPLHQKFARFLVLVVLCMCPWSCALFSAMKTRKFVDRWGGLGVASDQRRLQSAIGIARPWIHF